MPISTQRDDISTQKGDLNMSTKEFFTNSEELKELMSAARATITAPFFGNNVEEVKSVSEAYKLAKNSPGTIELTGMPVYQPEKLGLPQGANQLLFNDGTVVGRCAAARKIVGKKQQIPQTSLLRKLTKQNQ